MKRILLILGLTSLGGVGLLGVDNVKALVGSLRASAERNLISLEARLSQQILNAEAVREKCVGKLAEGRAALARIDATLRRYERKSADLKASIVASGARLESHRIALAGPARASYSLGSATLTREEYARELESASRSLRLDEEHLQALTAIVEKAGRDRGAAASQLMERADTPRRMELAIEELKLQLEILRALRAAAASQEGLTNSDSAFDEARDIVDRIEREIELEKRKIDLLSTPAPLPEPTAAPAAPAEETTLRR